MRRMRIAALLFLSLFTAVGLRAQREPPDNAIRFYEWKISRDPGDFFNYDRLGAAYIRKGRETGDVNYYDLAEKALNKSLALESTHREAISATVHPGLRLFFRASLQAGAGVRSELPGFRHGRSVAVRNHRRRFARNG